MSIAGKMKKKSDNVEARVLIVTLRSDAGQNLAPPIGAHQLSQYLINHGIGCDLLDRDIDRDEIFVERMRGGQYDVVGMSVSHIHMPEDLELLWRFRKAAEESGKSCFFVGGGYAATLNWQQWLEEGMDGVFLSFAEKSFFEFCQRVITEPPMSPDGSEVTPYIKNIFGTAYIDAEKKFVYLPAKGMTTEEFSDLCYTNVLNVKIPFHTYWQKLREECAGIDLGSAEFIIENIRLYTTSHCPRGCGFCNSTSFLRESQSAENAIVMLSAKEIEHLILNYVDEFDVRSFVFSDDDFPVGNKAGFDRLKELCHIIIAHKKSGRLRSDMRFSCQARIMDFVTRRSPQRGVMTDVLNLMGQAGFMTIGYGVETFSDRVMSSPSVNKVGATREDCFRVIDATLAAGMVPQTNIILGIPEYTINELLETIEIAADYIVKGVDISVSRELNALPGAPMFHNRSYEIIWEDWVNPHNERTVRVARFFKPFDPLLADVLMQFEEAGRVELLGVQKANGWVGKIVHKRIVGLATLIGCARLLKSEKTVKMLEELLSAILARKAA